MTIEPPSNTQTPGIPMPAAASKGGQYLYAIGYLRAFIIALVVAHHSAVAYHPFAPPLPASLTAPHRWWQAFPVIDPHRWSAATYFIRFNDRFFMALMFFLSGLFFWQGFQRKGGAAFLRGRLLRLGLPFAIASAIFAPIAYYPTYLQTSAHTGIAGFWQQWLALWEWPSGPAWFVWVLLAFDCIATLLFTLAPGLGQALRRIADRLTPRPAAFFAALVAVSALVYVPLALLVTPDFWAALGPFEFQVSRILFYFVYFLAAVGVGIAGVGRGLLAPEGRLAKHWLLWAVAALFLFAITLVAPFAGHATLHAVAKDLGFVFCCAASSFACLALFLRFMQTRRTPWDSLAANSYGIYLVHYMFVSWLQYALLPASLPGYAKFAIVFPSALVLSWITSATLRRIPAVARVV